MIKQKSYFHLILFVLLIIDSNVFFKCKKPYLTNIKDDPVRKKYDLCLKSLELSNCFILVDI